MTRATRLLLVVILSGLLPAGPATGLLFVSDDFDSASGGTGFAPASSWSAGLSIVTSAPAAPSSPEGLSSGSPSFRSLDPAVAATLDAQGELWVGFLARLDQPKTAASYAGVSFYAGGSERFFMGADWDGTAWGIQTAGFTAASSSVPAGASWVSLVYHFDFGAGQAQLYVDGVLEVASYVPLPARGWDQLRVASSTNPIYVDQLRIGTSQAEVRPSLGLQNEAFPNEPIYHCLSSLNRSCTPATEDSDCPGSFCETSKKTCSSAPDCLGVCDPEFGCSNGVPGSCNSDADCQVKSCADDRSRRCGDPNYYPSCNGFCNFAQCSSSGTSCQQESDCTGTCGGGLCAGDASPCSSDAECAVLPCLFLECSNNGQSCASDADCYEGPCQGQCDNTLEVCTADADCQFGSCTAETCVDDFCDTRDADIPIYSWKICPQCGQTSQDLGLGAVIVPADGIAYDRLGVGECLFDQSTNVDEAVIGYSPIVLTGGFDCCVWKASCEPEQTCGSPPGPTVEGTVEFKWGSMAGIPSDDDDADGIPDACDNCPETPNYVALGTCVAGPAQNLGIPCTSDAACGSGGDCSLLQEDGDADHVGDACDPDVIPEPGSSALLLPGIALLAILCRRRSALTSSGRR